MNRLSFFLLLLSVTALLQQQEISAFTTSTLPIASLKTNTQLALHPDQMRVGEIKAELQEIGVGFADCFDKESLVDKLLKARANPPPKRRPPPPRRRPAAAAPPPRTNVEFGAESDMNSDIDMDVFAQAGWTAESAKKGMSPVDHDRSPGLNRNFDDIPTDDFKKPYYG